MPAVFAALPAIFSAIGAAGAGVSAGLGIENALSGGGGTPTPSPYPTTGQVDQNKAQLANLVRQNMGNLQEAGGGGLSPAYDANVIGSTTGTLNQSNALQDIITQFSNGGSSGGTSLAVPTTPPTSLSGGQGLSDTSIFA